MVCRFHWDKLVPHFLVHYQVKALQEQTIVHFLQRPDFMLYSLVFGIKNLINKLWQQNSSAVVLPQECLRCEHYVATATYFSCIFLCVGTLLVEAKMLAAASSEDLNACIN